VNDKRVREVEIQRRFLAAQARVPVPLALGRKESVAAGESDFVDLIVSCLEIFGDDESAGRILIAGDTQDRARKIAEERGAAFPDRGIRNDLQDIGCGPVCTIGKELPTSCIARRGKHGGSAPEGFCWVATRRSGG